MRTESANLWLMLGCMLACMTGHAAAPPVELPHGPVDLRNDRTVPYDQPGPKPAAVSPGAQFGGYPCSTPECADDKAGYRWAEQHGITDPDSCTGSSATFIEGCRVYARRHSTD